MAKKANVKTIEQEIRDTLKDKITEKDEIAINMIINTATLYNDAVSHIEKEGLVLSFTTTKGTLSTKVNPYVNIMNQLQIQLLKLLQEFALTPKARKQMKEVENETDDFTDMLENIEKR